MKTVNCHQGCTPALKWITGYFHQNQIPYLVTGGLASIAYGARRPLADIDLYIPEDYFSQAAGFAKAYIIEGPARYRDENWDLDLVEIDYHGQNVEIASVGNILIFDQDSGQWLKQEVDFNHYTRVSINHLPVKVMNKTDLINYKKVLAREVDLADIAAIYK